MAQPEQKKKESAMPAILGWGGLAVFTVAVRVDRDQAAALEPRNGPTAARKRRRW